MSSEPGEEGCRRARPEAGVGSSDPGRRRGAGEQCGDAGYVRRKESREVVEGFGPRDEKQG